MNPDSSFIDRLTIKIYYDSVEESLEPTDFKLRHWFFQTMGVDVVVGTLDDMVTDEIKDEMWDAFLRH